MEIVWQHGETTVRSVLNAIRERRTVAYTTVMTLMDILYKKGHLTRIMDGKKYIYSAVVDKQTFTNRFVSQVVEQLFREYGEVAVNQFASEIEYLPRDLQEKLKAKLAELPNE